MTRDLQNSNPSVLHILGTDPHHRLPILGKGRAHPVALAVLLTFLLNPVVSVLHSRGLPRTPAVLVVVVLVFSVVGGIMDSHASAQCACL